MHTPGPMTSLAALQHGTRCDCHLQGNDAIPQPPAEVDEGLGALEAIERLEGSPAPADRPDQPLLPGREHHWGEPAYPCLHLGMFCFVMYCFPV